MGFLDKVSSELKRGRDKLKEELKIDEEKKIAALAGNSEVLHKEKQQKSHQVECPKGFTKISTGKCLRVIETKLSWMDAEIGLTDISAGNGKDFVWFATDEDTIEFSNWNAGD
jgi:hypothetical protein